MIFFSSTGIGFKVKGIFRLAANKSEIHRCRDALSLGKYEVITSKTDDPHTPGKCAQHMS